jgi:hypothetical protein
LVILVFLDFTEHCDLDIAVFEDAVGKLVYVVDAADRNRGHCHHQHDNNAESGRQAVTDFDISEIHFVAL